MGLWKTVTANTIIGWYKVNDYDLDAIALLKMGRYYNTTMCN